MKTQPISGIKLGVFVFTSILLLVTGLYYIGSNKNLFSDTITVHAHFNDVDGLMTGNNVRFNGINIGTVAAIYAVSDSLIKVEFTIEQSITKFINRKAVAWIGTDGLLGNKLLNISPGKSSGKAIRNGDKMVTRESLKMNTVMKTFVSSNDHVQVITENLRRVSENMNEQALIWQLLSNPEITENVKNIIVQLKVTGNNTAVLSGDLRSMVQDVRSGKGTIGALLTDTTVSSGLNHTIVRIESITDSLALLTGNFNAILQKIENGNGIFTTLLTDTSAVNDFNQSLENLKNGTKGFEENMDALKHSFLLKSYYKKQEKKNP